MGPFTPSCRFRLFVLLAALSGSIFACSGGAAVRMDKTLYITETGELISSPDGRLAKKFSFEGSRSFCLLRGGSPAAKINRKAVELALADETEAAEMLFKGLLADERAKAAACTNMGVLRELAGDDTQAKMLYAQACLLEPGNALFRKNLESLIFGK